MKKSAMTKVLPIALLVICMFGILSLSACSSGGSTEQEEAGKASEEPTYAIQIHVDCDQNLMFSKYDVDVKVDGDEIGNVDHGSESTFEVSLTKGQHELVFVEENRTSPDGKTSFVVEGEDDKFSFNIHCENDQIRVESTKDEAEEQAGNQTADEASEAESDKKKDSEPKEDAEVAKKAQFAKDIEACKGQTAAHAYEVVKDSGYEYKFKLTDVYRGSDITEDMKDERYAGARERATVTETSVNSYDSSVTFTVDRPLAITAEDNEDLAALLNAGNISMTDSMLTDFAAKYKGVNIEFDGYTSAHFQHGTYNTRFDYFIVAGDSVDSGMPFFFEDVNYSDFHWIGNSPDSVDSNLHCHFVAEVEKYDMALESTPIIYLDPVATTLI